jgi:hypothetical protein
MRRLLLSIAVVVLIWLLVSALVSIASAGMPAPQFRPLFPTPQFRPLFPVPQFEAAPLPPSPVPAPAPSPPAGEWRWQCGPGGCQRVWVPAAGAQTPAVEQPTSQYQYQRGRYLRRR